MIDTRIGAVRVLQINAQLLLAFSFGAIGWWLWPSSLDAIAQGILSLTFAVLAFALACKALQLIAQIRARTLAILRYTANVRPDKPARLAETDALDRAGML
ncbi:MAG: hypothetical protein AAGI34_18490 [Pseudomonadota bacterium]